MAKALIFEFNKLHSSGQGLQNYTQLTSTNNVFVPTGQTVPLNATTAPTPGLAFRPNNGSFELRATNRVTGQVTTSVINVDLDGLGTDDSLDAVVAKINAAPPAGLGAGTASVTSQGYLQITAPPNVEFGFGNDTSGFLAAMGVNTFFTGQDSRTIGVNPSLKSNGALLAVSKNNSVGDTQNLTDLIQFSGKSLGSLGGKTFAQSITGLVEDLGTFGENAQSQADAARTTKQALESENLSISGVSLDEEAVKLISFQRSFQASARYIATVNELLDAVINLGR
jgi:flagellar hook-associated protein 1 FlgK